MTPRQFARAELDRYLALMGVREARVELRVDGGCGLSDEGYQWQPGEDGAVVVTGGGDLGLLFGVYALLRDLGGCRFSGLGADGEHVPRRARLEALTQVVRREPRLGYRGIQFSTIGPVTLLHQQLDWMAKNGFNFVTVMLAPDDALAQVEIDPVTGERVGAMHGDKLRITESWFDQHLLAEIRKRGLKIDVNHHNLRFWLPPGVYGKAHPEWYAQIDGQRGVNLSQLCVCTSDDDAVATITANVVKFLRRRPEVRIVGVVPEDGNGMCQCAKCVGQDVDPTDATRVHNYRMGEENRSLANRYGRLLNAVARAVKEEFPKVLVGGGAYVDLQWPPGEVALEDNITMWLATYWRDGSRPLRERETTHLNAMFFELFKQWKCRLRGPVVKYAYYMGMNAQRGLPYPMARVICEDWRNLKRIGVAGATIQCLVSCHDAYGLNLAAFARCAWEDEVDVERLIDDYVLGMFGGAGLALRPVYAGLEDAAALVARAGTEMDDRKMDWSLSLKDEVEAKRKAFLHPMGNQVGYFLWRLGDVDAVLERTRAMAATDRERRQVERLAQYVQYWKLAAKSLEAADVRATIDYLSDMPQNGWFSRSARTQWEGTLKRLTATAAPAR